MKSHYINYFLLIVLLILCSGQVMENEKAAVLARKSTDAIYNMDFKEAGQYIRQMEAQIPQHPAIPLMKAYRIYWEKMPIAPDSKTWQEYHGYLEKAVELSNKMLEEKPEEPEAIFYALSAHSLMTKFYGDEHKFTKALGESKRTYKYLKKGFDMGEQNPEFYFYTGLYNFYREQYPESHPVVKPFVWVFMDGNKEKGIEELKIAAEKALITRPEAYKYLGIIYMNYLFQPAKALPYTKKLITLYPKNNYFRSMYVENLLELSEYKQAAPEIARLLKSDNPLYKVNGQTFKGLYYEKYANDPEMAQQYYLQAKHDGEKLPFSGKKYLSHTYTGLARIAISRDQPQQAREYYEKALEYAQYEKTKMEAENYLKQ